MRVMDSRHEPSQFMPPIPIDPETAEQLDAIARANRMTPQALVREALRQWCGGYLRWSSERPGRINPYDDQGPWDD